MLSEPNESWKELCQQASTEQDPTRLLELVQEVNRLLEEKQSRLNTNGNEWEWDWLDGWAKVPRRLLFT